jgi:hypothetical protein
VKKESDKLAPSVRRLVDEHKLAPAEIAGSGRDGRITKGDVLTHLAEKAQRRRHEGVLLALQDLERLGCPLIEGGNTSRRSVPKHDRARNDRAARRIRNASAKSIDDACAYYNDEESGHCRASQKQRFVHTLEHAGAFPIRLRCLGSRLTDVRLFFFRTLLIGRGLRLFIFILI